MKTLLKKIENNIGNKALLVTSPKHISEMKKTYCSTEKFSKEFNFKPKIKINEGLKKFNDWYISYHSK